MNLKQLIRSFGHAHRGIAEGFRSEQNMRIHGIAAAVALGTGLWLHLATWEWVAILICIALVLGSELLNTSIERLADRITTETDPLIKHAKDTAAGAVQIFAILALVVGLIIYLPKLMEKVGGA